MPKKGTLHRKKIAGILFVCNAPGCNAAGMSILYCARKPVSLYARERPTTNAINQADDLLNDATRI